MNKKIREGEIEATNSDIHQTDLDKRFEEYRAEVDADIGVKRATQFIRKALRGAFGRRRKRSKNRIG